MKNPANKFANFSNYEFAADGTVTKNGKAVKAEEAKVGFKYRLTNNDGDRQYVSGEDIKAAFASDEPVKASTATLAHSKGFTVDLSAEDHEVEAPAPKGKRKPSTATPPAPAKAAAPKKTAAPKAAAKKAAPKAVTAKKPAAAKEAKGTRTFTVLSVETVALIKKDLKAGTKAEGGMSMQELADKYGKSTSCIVNIKFGRIHKNVAAAK